MQAHFDNGFGMTLMVEADTAQELMQLIDSTQEVFCPDTKCGLCSKGNLRFRVREVKENKYYELLCQSCGGVLKYGVNKKGGGLWPKRKIDDGNGNEVYDKTNRGWTKYRGKDS